MSVVGTFPGGPFTISTTVRDYAAVRPRLGFAFDRFLVFSTGGWAWGDPLTSYALVGGAPFVKQNGSSTGWTAGLGVDYAVTESVFARIEYRYTSFTTAGFMSVATDSAEPPNHLPINDLRAALAYKFGGHQTQSNFKMFQICCRRFRAGFAHSVTNKSEVVTTG